MFWLRTLPAYATENLADETAIATGPVDNNQLLLNAFTKWCTWADLIIRIDKFHAFGVKNHLQNPIISVLT